MANKGNYLTLNIIKDQQKSLNNNIQVCDGKECGLGKYAGGGSYICIHNNLMIQIPDLVKEWYYERNEKGPENYLPKSNKQIWWICLNNKCGCHKWRATISNRTRDGQNGCPFCNISKPCPHNNLEILRPDLILEWNYEKNTKVPNEYSAHSNDIVSWKCSLASCNCHEWEASIFHRTNGSGCPYCNNRKICQHNNLSSKFPDITAEWDYDKNNLLPNELPPHSGELVWWKCSKENCGCHMWQARICDRTREFGTGCPFCNISKPCRHNNLGISRPDLLLEWDYDKNSQSPYEYAVSSNKKVYWICSKSECKCHKWFGQISNRASGKECPYCSNQKICQHNSFATLYPELLREWDYNRNTINPNEVSSHSGSRCAWQCNKLHRWLTSINHRVNGTGCPQCNHSKGFSIKQIEWIQKIMETENIIIQHAQSQDGEYRIKGIGKVDGYCQLTNTVLIYINIYEMAIFGMAIL